MRYILDSSHSKTALLTDIFVMLKKLSSEYQLYAPKGTSFRALVVKFLSTPRSRPKIAGFRTETR